MTVKELKEQLKNVDDNIKLIIEMVVMENDLPTERNELVDHVEMNGKEFYLYQLLLLLMNLSYR
jgi:hypothetical protein